MRGQLFAAPLAPLAAARLEGRRVDIPQALRQARRLARRHDLLLVEGCGGWEVPLTSRQTTADFFQRLGAPALLVSRSGLGALNHALLTLQAARARGVRVLGVVLNRLAPGPLTAAERTNPAILRRFGRVPVWGPIPFSPAAAARPGDRIDLRDLPDARPIARAVLRLLASASRPAPRRHTSRK